MLEQKSSVQHKKLLLVQQRNRTFLASLRLDMLFIKRISELKFKKVKPNGRKMSQCLSFLFDWILVEFYRTITSKVYH